MPLPHFCKYNHPLEGAHAQFGPPTAGCPNLEYFRIHSSYKNELLVFGIQLQFNLYNKK